MRAVLANVTIDSTGLIVTSTGRGGSQPQFLPQWAGLPFRFGNSFGTVASVQSGAQLTLQQPPIPQQASPVPMWPTREGIYQALFNWLTTNITGVTTFSRVPNIWSNYTPDQSPILWIEQVGEHQLEDRIGQAYNWKLDAAIGVYVFVADALSQIPASLLNPVLDQIEYALDPTSPMVRGGVRLYNLVQEVRLLASSRVAAGAIVNQAFSFVPLSIRVQ